MTKGNEEKEAREFRNQRVQLAMERDGCLATNESTNERSDNHRRLSASSFSVSILYLVTIIESRENLQFSSRSGADNVAANGKNEDCGELQSARTDRQFEDKVERRHFCNLRIKMDVNRRDRHLTSPAKKERSVFEYRKFVHEGSC